jgi:hypothetical protein
MKIVHIVATLLLVLILVYGVMTIYYRYTQPDLFICEHEQTIEQNIYIDRNEYISCNDGYKAYDVPYLGFLWKHDILFGFILLIIGGVLWIPVLKKLPLDGEK